MSGGVPAPEIRAEAAAWLARLHAEDRDAADEAAFRAWLNASPAHATAFEAVDRVWSDVGGLTDLRTGGSLLDQLHAVHVVRCDEAAWRFLGLSLAGYNVLISLALAIVAGFGLVAALLPHGALGQSQEPEPDLVEHYDTPFIRWFAQGNAESRRRPDIQRK